MTPAQTKSFVNLYYGRKFLHKAYFWDDSSPEAQDRWIRLYENESYDELMTRYNLFSTPIKTKPIRIVNETCT